MENSRITPRLYRVFATWLSPRVSVGQNQTFPTNSNMARVMVTLVLLLLALCAVDAWLLRPPASPWGADFGVPRWPARHPMLSADFPLLSGWPRWRPSMSLDMDAMQWQLERLMAARKAAGATLPSVHGRHPPQRPLNCATGSGNGGCGHAAARTMREAASSPALGSAPKREGGAAPPAASRAAAPAAPPAAPPAVAPAAAAAPPAAPPAVAPAAPPAAPVAPADSADVMVEDMVDAEAGAGSTLGSSAATDEDVPAGAFGFYERGEFHMY